MTMLVIFIGGEFFSCLKVCFKSDPLVETNRKSTLAEDVVSTLAPARFARQIECSCTPFTVLRATRPSTEFVQQLHCWTNSFGSATAEGTRNNRAKPAASG